ncbi:MAG: hypothetical protein JRJ41_08580 [Deltaproteobacteria bacterium]|nr:hypothetical protein [Deltaproteobacteria bacterium]
MDIYITLAVEDSLSEAVARKILYQSDKNYHVTNCLGLKGSGYLKAKINSFNKAAKELPFLVLTDQDNGCPYDKIKEWLNYKAHSNLIFRIAVMEIESWVMADRVAFSDFLSIPVSALPYKMDEIRDPKQFLLTRVRKSRSRNLVLDIVPGFGSTAKIGPNSNGRLSDFVRNRWDVHEAIKYSDSLYRAFQKLQRFKQIHDKRTQ